MVVDLVEVVFGDGFSGAGGVISIVVILKSWVSVSNCQIAIELPIDKIAAFITTAIGRRSCFIDQILALIQSQF